MPVRTKPGRSEYGPPRPAQPSPNNARPTELAPEQSLPGLPSRPSPSQVILRLGCPPKQDLAWMPPLRPYPSTPKQVLAWVGLGRSQVTLSGCEPTHALWITAVARKQKNAHMLVCDQPVCWFALTNRAAPWHDLAAAGL